MKYGLALFCFFSLVFSLAAAEGEPGQERYRPVPEHLAQALEGDGDLEYQLRPSPEEMTIWERFWAWLRDVYQGLFSKIGSPNLLFYLLLTLGIALVLYGIYRIALANNNGMFKRNRYYGPPTINEENLMQLNLDEELSKARENQQWRLFIRILYLQVLKQLDQQEVISLKTGKTNHDYAYEIGEAKILHPFNSLSRIFEYTWYGGFDADEGVAIQAEEQAGKLTAAK